MSAEISIEGLRSATGPRDLNRQRGKLDLPVGFETGRYACKWCLKGVQAAKAMQPEYVQGTDGTFIADGWMPWKDPKTKAYHTRTLASGVYVLMVRPKQLQEALQRMAGNVSRQRMEYEIKGQTIAGDTNSDTGMLPNEVLAHIPGLGREEMETPKFPFNPIIAETSGPSSVKVSSKTKIKSKSN